MISNEHLIVSISNDINKLCTILIKNILLKTSFQDLKEENSRKRIQLKLIIASLNWNLKHNWFSKCQKKLQTLSDQIIFYNFTFTSQWPTSFWKLEDFWRMRWLKIMKKENTVNLLQKTLVLCKIPREFFKESTRKFLS